jgi:hypothetical protein
MTTVAAHESLGFCPSSSRLCSSCLFFCLFLDKKLVLLDSVVTTNRMEEGKRTTMSYHECNWPLKQSTVIGEKARGPDRACQALGLGVWVLASLLPGCVPWSGSANLFSLGLLNWMMDGSHSHLSELGNSGPLSPCQTGLPRAQDRLTWSAWGSVSPKNTWNLQIYTEQPSKSQVWKGPRRERHQALQTGVHSSPMVETIGVGVGSGAPILWRTFEGDEKEWYPRNTMCAHRGIFQAEWEVLALGAWPGPAC